MTYSRKAGASGSKQHERKFCSERPDESIIKLKVQTNNSPKWGAVREIPNSGLSGPEKSLIIQAWRRNDYSR